MAHRVPVRMRRALPALLLLAAAVFALWSSGVFYRIDRQTSPDGRITTTVYSRDVSGVFPKATGFTIETRGAFTGTRVYGGSAVYESSHWSPCSNYQVISTWQDGTRWLELKRYEKNSVTNLNAMLNMGMSASAAFTDRMDAESWDTLTCRFLAWTEDPARMRVAVGFQDRHGAPQSATFVYDCESGAISDIGFAR